MKKYMIMGIFVLVIGVFLIYINLPQSISPPGSVLTQKMIIRDLKILSRPDSLADPVHLLPAESALQDHEIKSLQIHPDDPIIEVRLRSKKLFAQAYEVEYAMRVCLYLQERHKLAVVLINYNGGKLEKLLEKFLMIRKLKL